MTVQMIVAVGGIGFILAFAGAVLALIWGDVKRHRQQRRIETVEQLEALPEGVVVREASGFVWRKNEDFWDVTGEEFVYSSDEISLPAHILYLPGEEDR